MSGKRNVSVCRGHELANALYDACDAVHLSTEDALFDSRQSRTIAAVNVCAYTYM